MHVILKLLVLGDIEKIIKATLIEDNRYIIL
jgi:hypothetical protein